MVLIFIIEIPIKRDPKLQSQEKWRFWL